MRIDEFNYWLQRNQQIIYGTRHITSYNVYIPGRDIMHQIGKKIKLLRKNKGITQELLAEVLSVSSQSISKWENNLSAPEQAVKECLNV